jgi:hypothetical protein
MRGGLEGREHAAAGGATVGGGGVPVREVAVALPSHGQPVAVAGSHPVTRDSAVDLPPCKAWFEIAVPTAATTIQLFGGPARKTRDRAAGCMRSASPAGMRAYRQ